MIFQRNGVAGNSFYQIEFTDSKKTFIGTFETSDDDIMIKIPTCRITCLEQLNLPWRGDWYAYEIHKTFNKKFPGYSCIYDLMILINKK